jgi:hypothetical protein
MLYPLPDSASSPPPPSHAIPNAQRPALKPSSLLLLRTPPFPHSPQCLIRPSKHLPISRSLPSLLFFSPFPLTLRLTATKKVSIMIVSWSHSKRKRNATPQRRENPQRNLVTTTKERKEPKSLSNPTHTYTHLFEVVWLASLAVVQQPRRGRPGKLKAVPASGREPHQRRTDYYYYLLLLLVLFGFSSSTTVCRRPPSLFL